MTIANARVFKAREKQRDGKGFSREELKKAGTNMTDALKLKIPLDPRRKTAHEENIEAVKAFVAQKKAEQKPKKKPKKPEKKSKK
ncbi:ribosomal protein L13e [Candidatus Bathyarchaeota archaeon]|jgi:large subunit ribosomal protein L13e|nr:ribosomal protein L13e [Candidatus Bathyarchaeota archaeon]